MVAPNHSTSLACSSGMYKAALVLACLVLVASTLAKPSSRYDSDVSGDEVVIDQVEAYLRARGLHDQQVLRHSQQPQQLDNLREQQPNALHHHHLGRQIDDKIQFGVPPSDPRYYQPGSTLREEDNDDYFSPQYPPAGPPSYGDQDSPAGPSYANQDLSLYRETRLKQEHHHPGAPQALPQVLGPANGSKAVEGGAGEYEKTSEGASSDPEVVHYLQRDHHHQELSGHALRGVADEGSSGDSGKLSDIYFTGIVAGCTAAAVCAIIGTGICWYRLNKSHRAAADADYPAYGVTGPNKDLSPSSGDRKLAQSAHMYHYQHQKQQMIALEKSSGGERQGSASDVDSEEEGEEGDYTVYECPGLAPTGEMEVKNPLFHDDPTPITPSIKKQGEPEEHTDEDDDDDELEVVEKK